MGVGSPGPKRSPGRSAGCSWQVQARRAGGRADTSLSTQPHGGQVRQAEARAGPGRGGQAAAAPPGRAGCSALAGSAGLRGHAGGEACAPVCGSHAADKEQRVLRATRAEAAWGLKDSRRRCLGSRRHPRTAPHGPTRGQEPAGEAAAEAVVAAGPGGGPRGAAAAVPHPGNSDVLGGPVGPGRPAGALGDVPEAAEAHLRGCRQAPAGYLVSAGGPGERGPAPRRRPARARGSPSVRVPAACELGQAFCSVSYRYGDHRASPAAPGSLLIPTASPLALRDVRP